MFFLFNINSEAIVYPVIARNEAIPDYTERTYKSDLHNRGLPRYRSQ
jgi:hypothetical protein